MATDRTNGASDGEVPVGTLPNVPSPQGLMLIPRPHNPVNLVQGWRLTKALPVKSVRRCAPHGIFPYYFKNTVPLSGTRTQNPGLSKQGQIHLKTSPSGARGCHDPLINLPPPRDRCWDSSLRIQRLTPCQILSRQGRRTPCSPRMPLLPETDADAVELQ